MGNTLVPLTDLEYFSKILSLRISEKDHEIEQNSILSISSDGQAVNSAQWKDRTITMQ